jgi:penicillin amidase
MYLLNWNGVLSVESIGGTIYEVLKYNIVRDILERGLGEELTLEVMGKGFNPVLYHANEFYGHDTTIILRLLQTPDSWWIRQAGGIQELVLRNLETTVEWLSAKYGKDPTGWQWGKLHRVYFPHAMALNKLLAPVFNRGDLPIGGDTDTLCQTATHADDPYSVNAWAPSHRQIIDLNDFSKSLMIYGPGQSGHLASEHYDDLIQIWYKGEYHPMLWERDEIASKAEGRLKLVPESET